MTDPTLPEVLREMASNGVVRTHSESCWQWHMACAAMYAADMIEDLQAALELLTVSKENARNAD